MTGHESNKSPLNQQCLQALKALDLKPESQHPYSLQLSEWALENLELKGPWRENQADLLEQVRQMYGWKKPEQFLLNPETRESPSQSSPQALASELVENLYGNLQKRRPELRSDM